MIIYPSMQNSSKAPRKQMIAFNKRDGSNFRAKYIKKKGFQIFGSRNELMDISHPILGYSITLFQEKYSEYFLSLFGTKDFRNVNEIEVFGEYFGEHSFAGIHVDPKESMQLEIFDILLFNKSNYKFLLPQEFITYMSLIPKVQTPEVIYSGRLTDQFIEDVRNGKYNVFEGVVCKGTERRGEYCGGVWMAKIKTLAYFNLLKERRGSDWKKYWE